MNKKCNNKAVIYFALLILFINVTYCVAQTNEELLSYSTDDSIFGHYSLAVIGGFLIGLFLGGAMVVIGPIAPILGGMIGISCLVGGTITFDLYSILLGLSIFGGIYVGGKNSINK